MYTPLYANGKEPVIEEQDVYRIEIPYVPTLQECEKVKGQLNYIVQDMKEECQQTRSRGLHV